MDAKRPRRRPGSIPRAVIWLGGLLMLLAVADCVRGLPALFEARQRVSALGREVRQLEERNEQVRRDVKRLRDDPRALEEVARRDLGLMRKGEIVFFIVDVPPPERDAAGQPAEPETRDDHR